jgi:hypothetical protein
LRKLLIPNGNQRASSVLGPFAGMLAVFDTHNQVKPFVIHNFNQPSTIPRTIATRK